MNERNVVFLGLSKNYVYRHLLENKGTEIWSLNDCYQPYPWLKVKSKYNLTRIYQIHRNDPEKPNRFVRWKQEYNDLGCEIVTIKDWGLKNQRIINNQDYVDKFGYELFQCSLGWFFADAIMESVTSIHLMGVDLDKEGEWEYQRPSVLKAIYKARENGITVLSHMESKWVNETTLKDWANLKAVRTIYG